MWWPVRRRRKSSSAALPRSPTTGASAFWLLAYTLEYHPPVAPCARALNARLGGRATPGIRPSRNRRAMKAVAAGSNRDIGASTALRDALIGETCANPRRELLVSLQTRQRHQIGLSRDRKRALREGQSHSSRTRTGSRCVIPPVRAKPE